jgi:O-antigen/teichoic acid export membrane protein
MSEQLSSNNQAELVRRHRTAVRVARVLLALTVSLSAAAFLGRNNFRQQDNPALDMAVRIAILIGGLGSVVLRRSRFSAMRLRDIAALKGNSGLLATLERTTIQVALLGGAIALFGFTATLMTGNDFYAYGAGLVGLVVLLYCYPTRKSWQQAVEKFDAAVTESAPSPAS